MITNRAKFFIGFKIFKLVYFLFPFIALQCIKLISDL